MPLVHIHLSDLLFHGYHGLYAHEAKAGTNFLVQLRLDADLPLPLSNMDAGIDYGTVFALVKARMEKREALLENWAHALAKDLFAGFPSLTKLWVKIEKLQAPIPQLQGRVGISFEINRHELDEI